MEAKFINDSTLTRRDFIEISLAVKRKKSEFLYMTCGIIAIAFGILRFFPIKTYQKSVADAVIFILIGIVALLHPIYSGIFTGFSLYKKQLKLTNGDPLKMQILFHDDFLTVKSINGAQTIVNYPNILRDYETKNTYALMTKQNFCIFMNKSSFVKGSLEEVKHLITTYYNKK
ncbi:MAG: YcxB family protein [Lachnospiraceae bacterium]